MANLLVEIGNTAVKAAWAEGLTLRKTFRYQGEKAIKFILCLTEREKAEVMVVSSVYTLSSCSTKKLAAECNKLLILDNRNKDYLRKYDLPEYLSYDRAASIIAIRHYFKGRGCSLFDFGTTLTTDFLDSEGHHLGGNISPGCRTRFKSLQRYSKSLPLVDTPEKFPEIGDSIISSIEAGVISGIVYEIEGYSSKYPENVIVFTGGDAKYFAKRMKNSIFVVCNLLLKGLALIAEEYV